MWDKYPEVAKELSLVEEYIGKNIHSRNKLLEMTVKDLLSAGGKRIRPAFVIISGKIGKYNRKKIISIASALEILHTATLVHDDIIDNSKLRRGKKTVSEEFGTDMAVYTGDFLYTIAVLMLSTDLPIQHLIYVAKTIKSICEGEVDQYQSKFKANCSVYSYLKRIGRKTAILFASACGLGAYTGKCSKKQISLLTKFGFSYGMAFQIRDDLKDFVSTVQLEGKPILNDLQEGIYTLPVIYQCNKSSEFKDLLENYSEFNKDILDSIINSIKGSDAINSSTLLLNKYIKRGLDALEKLPKSDYTDLLKEQIELLRISESK